MRKKQKKTTQTWPGQADHALSSEMAYTRDMPRCGSIHHRTQLLAFVVCTRKVVARINSHQTRGSPKTDGHAPGRAHSPLVCLDLCHVGAQNEFMRCALGQRSCTALQKNKLSNRTWHIHVWILRECKEILPCMINLRLNQACAPLKSSGNSCLRTCVLVDSSQKGFEQSNRVTEALHHNRVFESTSVAFLMPNRASCGQLLTGHGSLVRILAGDNFPFWDVLFAAT